MKKKELPWAVLKIAKVTKRLGTVMAPHEKAAIKRAVEELQIPEHDPSESQCGLTVEMRPTN